MNDDGSTQVGGESGITTNPQGQTTKVGGSSGITIIKSGTNSRGGNQRTGSKGNSTASGAKPKGTGNTEDLAALIGALQGASSGSKNGTATAKTLLKHQRPLLSLQKGFDPGSLDVGRG